MVRIAQDGPRDVVFSVPEDKVAAMAVGSPVSGAHLGGVGPDLTGTVREVGASADPVTRTYAVKVALRADAAVPLGATVYVTPRSLSACGHAGHQAAHQRAAPGRQVHAPCGCSTPPP